MTRNIQADGYHGYSTDPICAYPINRPLPQDILSLTQRLYKRNIQFSSEFESSLDHIEFVANVLDDELMKYPMSIESLSERLRGTKCRNELIRFYVTLEYYDHLGCQPLFSKEEIWRSSLFRGPEYANWLSDAYTYAYRNSYGIGYVCPDQDFKDLKITNYSQVFSPRFLPRFNEDTDDIKKWMSDPPEYHNATVNMVIMEFENLLRSIPYLEMPDVESVLNTFKPTVTYVKGVKRRPHELTLEEHRDISVWYTAYESKVLVYPSGMRDTVILEKGSSNSVRIAEKLLLAVISHCKESIYTIGGDRIPLFKSMFSEMRGYHVLRDIKKCGLTTPISLYINPFVKLLEKYFPSELWSYLYIYSNIKITLVDGTVFYPKRGFGLGMANSFVTLLCILIHRIARREIMKRYPTIAVYAAIGNDDSNVMIVGGDINIASDYCNVECDVMTHAGFVINYKKNYIAETYHFFEEYGHPNFQRKEVLSVGLLAKGLLELNPRIAKMFVREAVRICPSEKIIDMARCIAYSRTYEFDPDEVERPYLLGGWYDFKPHIYIKGIESGEYLRCFDASKCYRALRVIKEFERIDHYVCDNDITDPKDNSNPIYRQLGYTGPAVRGVVGYYNVSVSGLYSELRKTWRLRNNPRYAYRVYKSILHRIREVKVDTDTLIKYALSLCCFTTPQVDGLSKNYNVMSTFTYEVPRFINISPSHVSAINKHLADLMEMDPHLPTKEDEYGFKNYTFVKTLMTDKDPRGLRALNEDLAYIGNDEEVYYPEVLSWTDIQYVIDRLTDMKVIIPRNREPKEFTPLKRKDGDIWKLGNDIHPMNEDYLEVRAFKVFFDKDSASVSTQSSYSYLDTSEEVEMSKDCTIEPEETEIEEYSYYLRSQETSRNEDDYESSELAYEEEFGPNIVDTYKVDWPISFYYVKRFLEADAETRREMLLGSCFNWVGEIHYAINRACNRVGLDEDDDARPPEYSDLIRIKEFLIMEGYIEEDEEMSEVSFEFNKGSESTEDTNSYSTSSESDA